MNSTIQTPKPAPISSLSASLFRHGGVAPSLAVALKCIVNTLPFNFLIGRDGKMAARHVQADELEARVMELLK